MQERRISVKNHLLKQILDRFGIVQIENVKNILRCHQAQIQYATEKLPASNRDLFQYPERL